MSEDTLVLEKMRHTPVVELPIFHKLKRKFSDTVVTPFQTSPSKKARSEMEAVNISARDANAEPVKQTSMGQKSRAGLPSLRDPATVDLLDNAPYLPSSLSPLQQTIEHQFNMQILMKHNELRLIEQELAKCQIALEQLRRCELRPYPGCDGLDLSLTEGRGPAVIPGPGLSHPSHPAPYHVTEGPYAHHYQQWLLRDEMFDPLPISSLQYADSPLSAGARSTRGVVPARKTVSKTTSMSTRHTEAQSSLPNYPAAPVRDKSAPLVLRRSTDGQLVKLICNNCHRGNFSSIQGFLNHCRIAHKVDYKSHDLAAIDCGHLLEEHEMATLPQQTATPAAPAAKPAVSRTTSTTVTPARGNLVHPLNLINAHPVTGKSNTQRALSAAQPVKDLGLIRSANTANGPLKPSSDVPRLSRLFAKHNFGGDLEKATALARQRIDLTHDDDLSPDSSEQNSPIATTSATRPFTMASAQRPESRKGHRQPTAGARPRPAPIVPHDADNLFTSDLHSAASSSATFSPNTIAESNPGLVSDHEDDDHDASASEEESSISHGPHHHHHHHHHHMNATTRSCADQMEIDVDDAVDVDGEDVGQHGVLIRRNSVFAAGSPSRKIGKAGSK